MTTATNTKITDDFRDSINGLLALQPRIKGMEEAIVAVIKELEYVQNADLKAADYNEMCDAVIKFALRRLTEAMGS